MGAVRGRISKSSVVGLIVAAATTQALSGVASATTARWDGAQVSCTIGNYTQQKSILLASTGTVTIYQTKTSDNVPGQYHLEATSGNNTSAKNMGDGQSKSWSSVIKTKYYVWHTAAVDTNCNGSLPGNGNTLFTGKVVFP